MTIQPNNERKFRLECLQLAVSTMHPDEQADLGDVVKRAETLYRYVVEGASEVASVVRIAK
jgi:hypothetical protein